jgi:phosphoadenosine phosphosulfate reductase
MKESSRTFSPGKSDIFWCQKCNLPILSEKCICGSPGKRVFLSPPADIRLCSSSGIGLLRDLFEQDFGFSDFLDGRIILLNKIAGIDRRDQVILDGHHIATLLFDITSCSYRLDLEPDGAALLALKAKKKVVVCSDSLLKGHVKGKWLSEEKIESKADNLSEGDNVILKIGKFSGAGVVRRRADGSVAIRIKGVTQKEIALGERRPALGDIIKANEEHLRRLEKMAVRELETYLSRTRLPVNVSFSGGKDSLASLLLCQRVKPGAEALFIDTHLEFPETVEYVRGLCSAQHLKLRVISGEDGFFPQAEIFGPPAKDFRWCCKTNKLGPMTSFIKRHYPKGCVTIEGRRIYESFNRAAIKAVERNPYVPGQTTLNPIRNWRALEVMLYIHWKGLKPNPLYEKDFERIGCWLCPASLQSEFAQLAESHPELYARWSAFLQKWADENGLDQRYIDWGFWRWRRHPPKMVELARAHRIELRPRPSETKTRKKTGPQDVDLRVVRGRSPCGLEYSIEADLSAPQNQPFEALTGALKMLGEVSYSEDIGAAVVRTNTGRITIFANGHIMVIAPEKAAEDLLRRASEIVLRVQMCTRCKICEKNCSSGAISIRDTIVIDERRCKRCGKCSQGCIAEDQASKILRELLGPVASRAVSRR